MNRILSWTNDTYSPINLRQRTMFDAVYEQVKSFSDPWCYFSNNFMQNAIE